MLSKVIPAVDTSDRKELIKLLVNESDCKIVKINYEIAFGGLSIVPLIKSLGHEVFLDLKLYDIPNTMKRVCERLNHYEVDYITVHGEAPLGSIKAAVSAFKGRVLVVCGLTSMATATREVLASADAAYACGAYGVITNVHQVADIKRAHPELVAFCPGIRLRNLGQDDQKVVGDPDYAFANGADYIICGRSFQAVKEYYGSKL